MRMKDFDITMTQYNRGDIVTGTIVMITDKNVIVALGGLKEGTFPKVELDAPFKVGDAILVMITGKIDDNGLIVLTHAGVNKAIEQKEKLKDLKVGSELSFDVKEISQSGLIGDYSGYRVFLPYSQCSSSDYMDRDNLLNKEITAIVVELDNIKHSIVCSTKLLERQDITPIAVGDVLTGRVIKLDAKYAILLLSNGSRAKLSIADVSYEHIKSMEDKIELNAEYEVKVLEVNTDFSRVSVGMKQLTPDPTETLINSLNIGDEVEGTVVKILPVGALIKLDNGLTALAITKENTDKANVATHHIYKLNARVNGYISNINKETNRINIITNKSVKIDN